MSPTRTVDAAIAALGLVMLSPLLLTLAVLVLVRSGRPVIFVAPRVGAGGRIFGLYKFRTMTVGAAAEGPAVTVKGDARVTPIGRVLRDHKLDELPQLLNVLKGDMSLVGPRPEDPRYVARYTPAQRQILRVRPGVTSTASLAFKSEEELLAGPDWEERYVKEIMPTKLRMEIEYECRRSLLTDLGVIVSTVLGLLRERERSERAGGPTT